MGTTFGLHPPQPNPHKPGQGASAHGTLGPQNGAKMASVRAGDRYIHSKFEKKKGEPSCFVQPRS